MKDLVENRRRIPFGRKLKIAFLALRENGLLWSFYFAIYYAASALSTRAFAAMDSRRRKKQLPGLNSAKINRLIWESWDWSAGGEEWTPSPQWKQAVVEDVLYKNIPEGTRVLEIGPGGGRWTAHLIARASHLTAADISESCIATCRQKFAHHPNATFFVSSGSDLRDVADHSIDHLWSFDVFVHINRREFESYAKEFARVLAPGARGVIHHGTVAGKNGGWRSDVTGTDVLEILRSAGLHVDTQFSQWKNRLGEEFDAGLYADAITVFSKPNQKS